MIQILCRRPSTVTIMVTHNAGIFAFLCHPQMKCRYLRTYPTSPETCHHQHSCCHLHWLGKCCADLASHNSTFRTDAESPFPVPFFTLPKVILTRMNHLHPEEHVVAQWNNGPNSQRMGRRASAHACHRDTWLFLGPPPSPVSRSSEMTQKLAGPLVCQEEATGWWKSDSFPRSTSVCLRWTGMAKGDGMRRENGNRKHIFFSLLSLFHICIHTYTLTHMHMHMHV